MTSRYLLLWALALLAFPAFSQAQFEKGYLIDNQDQKISCLLRNAGWENNPASFRYKLTRESELLTAGIADVKEFGTDDGMTYVRVEVRVDESSTDVGSLSRDRNPMWVTRTVFLNQLLTGPAKLFLYRSGNLRQFYYQKADSLVVPLIYKQYINDDGQEMSNFGFRQQLLNDVACDAVSRNFVSRLLYREGDLVAYFEKYNACVAPDAAQQQRPKKRDALHLKITPGLNLTMLSTERFTMAKNGKTKSVTPGFRVGAEAEYVLPVNRNKWSIIVEPVWQYYQLDLNTLNTDLNVDFWSIDVTAGGRHYFSLKGDSRIFVNAMGIIRAKNGYFKNREQQMEVYTNWFQYAGGIGFINKRLSGEIRYISSAPFSISYMHVDAAYTRLALVLGYRLF